MKAFAIILAAGRGSRMKNLTAEKPKCLLELAGKPLLFWQEKALEAAGIHDIHIVRGYKGECLPDRFKYSENKRWAETNMLYSLDCAAKHIEKMFKAGFDQFVISYADIVYASSHVEKLLANPMDMAIAYDTCWETLWKLRFENVLDDAETFLQKDGLLKEIGGKTDDIANIAGQYMGLIKLTAAGWQEWQACAHSQGFVIDKADMTSFLRKLLAENREIGVVPVAGKWCEADNASDLETYETALASGSWSHDWREENETS